MTKHSRPELAALLSNNIGIEKAQELVTLAADELALGPELTREQALDVLERVAGQPGLIGIAARFAKSRVLLRWSST